MANGFTILVSL